MSWNPLRKSVLILTNNIEIWGVEDVRGCDERDETLDHC
jgi:hypothetical protein